MATKKWYGMPAKGGAAVGMSNFIGRVIDSSGTGTAKMAKRTAQSKRATGKGGSSYARKARAKGKR